MASYFFAGLSTGLVIALATLAVYAALLSKLTRGFADRLMAKDYTEFKLASQDVAREPEPEPEPEREEDEEEMSPAEVEELGAMVEAGISRFLL